MFQNLTLGCFFFGGGVNGCTSNGVITISVCLAGGCDMSCEILLYGVGWNVWKCVHLQRVQVKEKQQVPKSGFPSKTRWRWRQGKTLVWMSVDLDRTWQYVWVSGIKKRVNRALSFARKQDSDRTVDLMYGLGVTFCGHYCFFTSNKTSHWPSW